MEDNFELRYVFTYTGIINRAELVPSPGAYARGLRPGLTPAAYARNGALRRWLGDYRKSVA
jgi:hypothetical protein